MIQRRGFLASVVAIVCSPWRRDTTRLYSADELSRFYEVPPEIVNGGVITLNEWNRILSIEEEWRKQHG